MLLLFILVKFSFQECLSDEGVQACRSSCDEDFITCQLQCDNDPVCQSQCSRLLIECTENCPCGSSCPDGCPCLNQFCSTWRVEVGGYGIVEGKADPLLPEVIRFLGIPFGEVNKRFEPAELKLQLNKSHHDGSKFGPQCPSSSYNSPKYNENCLVLDVFVPKQLLLTNNTLNPVSVYVHGGAFSGGSSHAWVRTDITGFVW